jgi:hypothetical protein
MASTTPEPAKFSMADLSIFERHGATVDTQDSRAGCWIKLPNGWVLSVQWGGCNYGSNYDRHAGDDVPDATAAEVAAWQERGNGLVEWADGGDTVLGYASVDRVLHILDLLAEDKLMQDYQPPMERRAVDGWQS